MARIDPVCVVCGEPLMPYARSDAKTCSANCRKALSRRKDRVKTLSHRIISELVELDMLARRNADLRPDVAAQLREIRANVSDILRLADQNEMVSQAERNGLVAAVQTMRERESVHYLTPAEARAISKHSGV